MATKTKTKAEKMNCIPCKIIIDCGALIVAAEQFAEMSDTQPAERIAAKGMARYIDRYIEAYALMDAKGLTKGYEEEAAAYSQSACDFALRIDAFRAGAEGAVSPTAAEFDAYKHELLKFGQELAGYGTDET
jgi:hypothetical protein